MVEKIVKFFIKKKPKYEKKKQSLEIRENYVWKYQIVKKQPKNKERQPTLYSSNILTKYQWMNEWMNNGIFTIKLYINIIHHSLILSR